MSLQTMSNYYLSCDATGSQFDHKHVVFSCLIVEEVVKRVSKTLALSKIESLVKSIFRFDSKNRLDFDTIF